MLLRAPRDHLARLLLNAWIEGMLMDSRLAARVLVVEDDAGTAEILALLLAEDGYHVDIAASGVVALQRLRAREYDVILSDLRMPELDGPGFYRELERSRPELLRRVVFVTGSACDPVYEGFLAHAARPVIPKPFRADDLRRAMRGVLSGV